MVYVNIDLNLARVEIRKSFVQRDKQMCYGWIKKKKKDLSSLLFCLSESLANLLNFGKLFGLPNWSVKYYLVNLLSEINTENRTLIHFKVGVYHGILLVFDKQ